MSHSVRQVLVTGGAGFIGSHLIDRLMARGDEVVCLEDFYTGAKRNILKWLSHLRFELIRHDITEPIWLEAQQIYHLACPASPAHYQYNPVKTIKTNLMGTFNRLGLARRVKAWFLLASSSEVDGLMTLMDSDCLGPFNLGNPDEHTTLDLTQTAQFMVDFDGGIQFSPLLQDDPRQRRPDITLAKTRLIWASTIVLSDGLRLSNDGFRERFGAPVPATSPP